MPTVSAEIRCEVGAPSQFSNPSSRSGLGILCARSDVISGMSESVWLERPSGDVPWGFRLHGGRDFRVPLSVQKVCLRH